MSNTARYAIAELCGAALKVGEYMQTLRGKLFLSGMDENAASLARKWGLGLELTDFCEARKLEEPAAMEAARARCSGIGSLWLHAPFAELSPCAIDPRVREVVMLRFRQTVQAALALGMERAEPDIMSRPPRSARESIFAHGVGFDCVYQGVMCAVLTLAAFFIGHYMEYGVWTVTNSPDGTTMAFLTLSMAEIFHSFNMRAHRASLFTLRTPNWALVGAAAASLALTTLCIYVPFLANAFDFTPISAAEYAVAMGLAFLVLPIVEGVKCVQRAAAKRAARA